MRVPALSEQAPAFLIALTVITLLKACTETWPQGRVGLNGDGSRAGTACDTCLWSVCSLVTSDQCLIVHASHDLFLQEVFPAS